MRKILSIVMVVIIFCVSIIGANAVYYQHHYYDIIDGYDCDCYIGHNNSHGANSCVGQTNIVKIFGEPDQMVMAGVQLVVEYTDGTFDIDSYTDVGYSNWSYVSAYIEVPQGKVVICVIAEHHIYWNNSYVCTRSSYINYGDGAYN